MTPALDRLVLHVGYMKTATTWLQQVVFEGLEDRIAVPWPTGGNRILEEVCWPGPYDFDPGRTRSAFAEALGEDPRVPVISHESLVGDPTQKLWWGEETARRLARTFPSARVLITIREQGGLGAAIWQEYVLRGGTLSAEEFFFRAGRHDPGYRAFCPPETLRLSPIVRLYQEHFGTENVLVLPIELLKTDSDAYADRLFRFMRVERPVTLSDDAVYERSPARFLAAMRMANRLGDARSRAPAAQQSYARTVWRMSRALPKARLERAQQAMFAPVKEGIRTAVAADNALLAEVTGLPLESWGYAFPPEAA